MTVPGCGYCGLPRARVRLASGQVVRVPACRSHLDLLELDPFYRFAGAIAAELRGDVVEASTLSSSSSRSANGTGATV